MQTPKSLPETRNEFLGVCLTGTYVPDTTAPKHLIPLPSRTLPGEPPVGIAPYRGPSGAKGCNVWGSGRMTGHDHPKPPGAVSFAAVARSGLALSGGDLAPTLAAGSDGYG